MSVKTREHRNSIISTTTDHTEVPNRFIPPKQTKYPSHHEDEMFPPNDFVSYQTSQQSNFRKQVEGPSHFGQAINLSFRPDQNIKNQDNQRQYSFAPQVKEESESVYSSNSNHPSANPSKLRQVDSKPINNDWTPKPPLSYININENKSNHPQDYRRFPHQDIQSEPLSSRKGYPNIQNTGIIQPHLFLQQDCLPQEVLFLLAEEDNHIGKYRTKVEKEKAKIELDMSLVQTEFHNIIEELKMQMQNFVDDHYKRYIGVYAAFKDEIIQLKQQKLSAPLHLTQPIPKTDLTNASNQNLIRELEDLSYKTQLSKLNQYVGDLNRARTVRIGEISKDLLQLTSSGGNLYNAENTKKQLEFIKQDFKSQLIQKFEQMSDYVQPLDYQISNDKSQINIHNLSQQSNTTQSEQEIYHHPHHITNRSTQPQYQTNHPKQQDVPQFSATQPQYSVPQPQYSAPQQISGPIFSAPFSIGKQVNNTNDQNFQKSSHFGQIPNSCEQLQLKEAQVISLNHQQMPLCFIQIKDSLMATGSRDGKIKVWDGSKEVKEFSGHVGGVCCLALIKQQGVVMYMVSGSDHIDNSIIVWNLQTFQQVGPLDGHGAAVVALLSLEDGHTIVSASYDKSLLIWGIDVDKQQAIQKLGSAHNNAVTCLSLSPDKQYFVSGGLDSLLNIWKLKYRNDGRFESTYLEKTLKNNSIVCSLSTYQLDDQLRLVVGGKDGKLREWNLQNGDMERQVAVCVGPIVEMIVFKGPSHTLILSMSTKDKNLLLSNLESGENQVVDVREKISVEFGCGVFPKMSLHQGQLIVLSQSDLNQNISKFSLDWS